ncbi:hypothetical protein [Methanolapillus millepedarum]|uniref:Uncharacterized protein n=1 Tax=Methanolapillus millepedarum TaxID=3028296 RepID=A0AA96VDQ4_9EURY|nr:hypothetical protein MsAc7_03220 [Methanosarcinaceae archaeon Ac7]
MGKITPLSKHEAEQMRYDIIQAQRRSPLILSEFQQRVVMVSNTISPTNPLSMTKIKEICQYKYLSAARKLAERMVKEWPDKYELETYRSGRTNKTILKLSNDYCRFKQSKLL